MLQYRHTSRHIVMTLEQYSLLLSLGLAVLTVLVLAGALVPPLRERVIGLGYLPIMAVILGISGAAVVGALIYQLAYLTPVCELCWWQRIFLFPVAIVSGAALVTRSRDAHVPIAVLSAIGLAYALYHYWYHYQGLVLGNVLALPCSSGGLLPACTESPILTFGFVTIPLMGIAVFSMLLLLCGLARAAKNRA